MILVAENFSQGMISKANTKIKEITPFRNFYSTIAYRYKHTHGTIMEIHIHISQSQTAFLPGFASLVRIQIRLGLRK